MPLAITFHALLMCPHTLDPTTPIWFLQVNQSRLTPQLFPLCGLNLASLYLSIATHEKLQATYECQHMTSRSAYGEDSIWEGLVSDILFYFVFYSFIVLLMYYLLLKIWWHCTRTLARHPQMRKSMLKSWN